jgi:single-stranded DNA-binding protein
MSLHILATGSLIGDPVRRTSAKGNDFGTATLRCHTENGEYTLVSVVAFNEQAEQLLAHRQGGTVAVSGRARLNSWAGRDGAEHHGLAVVAEQIASASAARRADAEHRRGNRAAA